MPAYQEYTYRSQSPIKRWLHQKRFDQALKILDLKKTDLLLDYGCGDGYLLKLCSKIIPSQNLFGFDPADIMHKEAVKNVGKKIKVVKNINELNKKFTKIACLETCEHLADGDLKILLSSIKKLLVSNGQIIISVPIETGIPATLKNLFRFAKNKNYDNLSFNSKIKALFSRSIVRKTTEKISNINYIYTHIGFNHRNFELLLKDYFKILRKSYSPINFLGPGLNNTIYYVCKK